MARRIDLLIAQLLALPPEDRQELVRALTESMVHAVRDSDPPPYGAESPKGSTGVKSVIVTLPDDLATQAQAAGLLDDKLIEELIRRELRHQTTTPPAQARQRNLIPRDGRLVVEALPGEQRISADEVRDLLNRMEW